MLQSTGNDALQNACVKVFRIRPDATEHWRPVGDYALLQSTNLRVVCPIALRIA